MELVSQEIDQLARELVQLREKVNELEERNATNKSKINDLSIELKNTFFQRQKNFINL